MSTTGDEASCSSDEQLVDRRSADLEPTRDFAAKTDFLSKSATLAQLGDFKIVRELGRGGMGTVYEAEDAALGRRVALKVLRFGALGDAAAVERFQREAATVAKLHHTNIVPIFSVGSQDGVYFYAMQFVEGRTLADVLREGPVDLRRASQWALEAAEALAHAHHRGVIHRDIKPSNMLLDGDDRVWLTDFGLARRVDDPALTATDALLGTPRYMSPEQASLKRSEIDNRTDIFSLGATLYELVTGRPAFEGDSSHHVIQAILTIDPDSPRRLRPEIPRDLDTIVMKCLAKDPAQRYASASALADDLRAFLDSRAIRARQPSLAERAGRWVRRQRRSVLLAAGSIAATLLMTLATVFVARVYHRWQLAFLDLGTDEPPMVVELFDRDGAQVVAPTSIPTQQPLELAPGAYTLRAGAPGRLSQTMQIALARGDSQSHRLSLRDQTLWPTLDVPRTLRTVPGPTHDDLLLFDGEGVKLVDGATSETRWTRKLADAERSLLPGAPRAMWAWDKSMGPVADVGPYDLRPMVLPEYVDLNRDGRGDYVLAARRQAWLLALSGVDGQSLWLAPRGSELSAEAPLPPNWGQGVISAVLSPPAKIADIDGDGVADLLAVCGDLGGPLDSPGEQRLAKDASGEEALLADPEAQQARARRWLEAVSDADGKTIWRYDLDPKWFEVVFEDEVPEAFRWFVGASVGDTMSGLGRSDYNADGIVRREPQHIQRVATFAYSPQVAAVGDKTLLCIAGRHLLLLDTASGKPTVDPLELPSRPGRPVQLIDLDRDGLPEVVGIEEILDRKQKASTARLFIWSLSKKAVLWQRMLEAAFPHARAFGFQEPKWPVVADVNGDGQYELLVPNGTWSARVNKRPPPTGSLPYGGLEACDALSGKRLWRQRILTVDQQTDYFLIGPDIDGDGYRDVFAASLWSDRFEPYFDALSGSDGRKLWFSHMPGAARGPRFMKSLTWWSEGRDGAPQLVAAIESETSSHDSSLILLSAASGKVADELSLFDEFVFADLDGDGQQELLRQLPKTPKGDRGSTLNAYSGALSEQWRWLGGRLKPVADLDGDGMRDLVQFIGDGPLRAVSGASGQLLWTNRIRGAPVGQISEASADLDGDGTPDLLFWNESSQGGVAKRLYALASKSGRTIWTANFEAGDPKGPAALLTGADLDSDGKPEVVLMAAMESRQRRQTSGKLWVAVLDGENGTARWKRPLVDKVIPSGWVGSEFDRLVFEPIFGDLNGDGVRDMVLPAQSSADAGKFVCQAIDGKRGQTLWEHPLPATGGNRLLHRSPQHLIVDLDGDGTPEVYVLGFVDDVEETGRRIRLNGTTARLLSLSAADGKPVWSCETQVAPGSGTLTPQDQWSERPKPHSLRRVDGQNLICLNLTKTWGNPNAGEIISLDTHGNVVSRIKVTLGFPRRHFRLWTDDLTGDGNGDLLFIDGDALKLADPMTGSVVWTVPLPRPRDCSFLGVLPSSQGPPAFVVQEPAPGAKVYGLDGASGARRWVCPVPGQGFLGLLKADVLDLQTGAGPPTLAYAFTEMSVAVKARFTDRAAPPATPGRVGRQTIRDPRLARPFPWHPTFPAQDAPRFAWFAAWGTFYCLTLLLFPGAIGWWIVSHSRWSLQSLALLHLAAAVFLAAWLLEGPQNDLVASLGRFGSGALALPVVLALLFIARSTLMRRWRKLLRWLVVCATLTVVFVVWWLGHDWPHRTQGQYYSLDGWYWICLLAAYATAVLATMIHVLRAVSRWYERPYAGAGPNQGQALGR